MGLEGTTTGNPMAMIDSAKGMWRIWNGAAYVDTDKLVQYDIWNHVQLAIDPARRTYRVTVQPIGEVPKLMGQGPLSPTFSAHEPLQLVIKPSATEGHISCYDNLKVTRD
jgi:L-rhamnose isomerase